MAKRKKRGGLAVRRANYTHRRKGVFNVQSIVDLRVGGNVRYRTDFVAYREKKQGCLPFRELLLGCFVQRKVEET